MEELFSERKLQTECSKEREREGRGRERVWHCVRDVRDSIQRTSPTQNVIPRVDCEYS